MKPTSPVKLGILNTKRSAMTIAIAMALGSISISPGIAQTAAPAAAPKTDVKADDGKLETITVTAQRRDEELQKVPISITTLSAKELEQKQVRRLDDIKFEVPNIVIEPNTGTSSGAKVFMRGVGTDESLFTADPSVAIYIDDIYIPRQTGALFDLFDVQRIEILRGPQGTLYGRNAPGGAIRYVTAKPNGVAKFDVDGRVGNLGRADVRASLSTKLGETVDASFAVMSKNRDGYLTDLTNGGKLNNEKVIGARASFAFPILSSTRLTVALDTVKQTSGPTFASGIVDSATAAQFNRPINNSDNNLLTVETNLTNGKNDLEQSGVSLVSSTDFDAFTWRNIYAYRKMHNLLYIDLDGTAATRFHLYQDQNQHQNSFESQLISSGSGAFSWQGGLFYFDEYNDQPTRQDIFATGSTNYITQKTKASALYGQADYRFTPILKATLGIRSSRESKNLSIISIRTTGIEAFRLGRDNTWTNTDWKFGLDAQITNDVLAYVSASTGFKSGGFNGRASSLATFTTLKPETVKNYEVGLKTTLADGAVRFNINYFSNKYKDLQLTAFDNSGLSVLTNASSASIKGVEIEAVAQVTKDWQINANLGTLDGKYQDFSTANSATFSGKQLKQAPKQQWGLGTSYRIRLDSGSINVNVSGKRVGDHYQNLANSELIKTKAYTLADARVSYDTKGGAWSVALWGKNLGNKLYYTGGFDISSLGIADAYINVPRTYGIEARYRFW